MPDVSHLTVVQDWDEPDVPRDLLASQSRHPAYRARSPYWQGKDAERADILALLVDARDEAADWGPDGPRGNPAVHDTLDGLIEAIVRGDHREQVVSDLIHEVDVAHGRGPK